MPTDTAWLGELKAGDKVIVQPGGYYAEPVVTTVERVTAKQILVRYQQLHYWKESGREVAKARDYIGRNNLIQWTQEAETAIHMELKRQQLVSALKAIQRKDTRRLTSEQCARLLEQCEHLLAVLAELGLWQAPGQEA